ncbi:hypothetical protein BRADI_3g37323v3 [Brachypodium distachyon]|uniref:Reverse transcriptase zinc-binding domain-containing protein n=1 Tax=Brachypodium distachyon TaxID=15368 RepID=A0A2K2D1R1_BRADI|nr:hypothetical protein BRADI_3g37323v3 [Brachypodium distachyon]
MKLSDQFLNITSVSIGSGRSALFWSDKWNGHLLKEDWPHLFSFVVDGFLSVEDVVHAGDVHQLSKLPLSQQASAELALDTGDDTHCVLCQLRVLEDWQHLFFSCAFSRRIWAFLQIDWCSGPSVDAVQRNGLIFDEDTPSFRSWRAAFVHDLSLLKHRFRPGLVPRFTAWLDSLLCDNCNR